MPNQTVIPVDAGQLPLGFCPATLQDQLNGFASVMSVTLSLASGATGIVVSASKPAATNVIWLQLDPLGRPIRQYWFGQGSWISLHPMVPGMIVPWIGALPDFTSFDGGDANGISATSGAMWQVATALQGKFPVGAGNLTSGAVVNTGDTGGNDLQKQILDHKHVSGRFKLTTTDAFNPIIGGSPGTPGLQGESTAGGGSNVHSALDGLSGDWMTTDSVTNIPNPNTQTVLPPYLGINFLQRTARLYYSVT